MTQVSVLRKIVESLKDLVTEVNIEATPTGKNSFNFFRSFFTSHGLRSCILSIFTTKRVWL
jgi:hypothetical protein